MKTEGNVTATAGGTTIIQQSIFAAQVSPFEVEDALTSDERVHIAIAYGIPSELLGEALTSDKLQVTTSTSKQ